MSALPNPPFNLQHFDELGLRLFILSSEWNGPHWPQHALGLPVTWLNADETANRRFAFVLNAANGASFGDQGIGMPMWVMQDCVLMPGAFFGVMGKAKLFPTKKRELINQILSSIPLPMGCHDHSLNAPLGDEEWIPIAEAAGTPAAAKNTITTFSLYSFLPGLAVVSKALMFSAYGHLGMREQIGIGQFDNRSFAAHSSFGLLEILNFAVSIHTLAGKTFHYKTKILPDADLTAIARGEWTPPHLPTAPKLISVNDIAARAEFEKRRQAETHRYYLAAPGITPDGLHNPIIEVENDN